MKRKNLGITVAFPCDIGETFYGIQGESIFAYVVEAFKVVKDGTSDNYSIVFVTTYDMEFVYRKDAFLTKTAAEAELRSR